MIHEMNLNPRPCEMIAEGKKTIELRLLDEKRRKIAVGDTLIFTNTDDLALQLRCVVKKLHCFDSFTALYEALPLEKCGYLPEELADARWKCTIRRRNSDNTAWWESKSSGSDEETTVTG